mgnify:CR=1 FL=1
MRLNKLYKVTDSLDNGKTTFVLQLLDDNYGKLQMFDKQIGTREQMQQLGVVEAVNFYDIYASMGLYRKAMNQYIQTVGITIPDNDHLGKARYHNQVGMYLFLDKSAPTAINEFNKALGYLKVYENDISEQKTENDLFIISPNPAQTNISINSNTEEIFTATIFIEMRFIQS